MIPLFTVDLTIANMIGLKGFAAGVFGGLDIYRERFGRRGNRNTGESEHTCDSHTV